jgi:hypothetical protein
MSEAETKTDWLGLVRGWSIALLVIGLSGVGVWYLIEAPYPVEPPDWFYGSFGLVIVGLLVLCVIAGSSSLIDQFNWHGPIPADVPEGYAWRRSIRSRLEGLGNLVGLVLSHYIVFTAMAAWQNQDWGRLAVTSLLLAMCLYVAAMRLLSAISGKIVLTIDRDGMRGLGIPKGGLAWDSIERLAIGDRPEAPHVTAFMVGADGRSGRAHSIGLDTAGISARRFAEKVSDLAPQVEISWPTPRFADFSAA